MSLGHQLVLQLLIFCEQFQLFRVNRRYRCYIIKVTKLFFKLIFRNTIIALKDCERIYWLAFLYALLQSTIFFLFLPSHPFDALKIVGRFEGLSNEFMKFSLCSFYFCKAQYIIYAQHCFIFASPLLLSSNLLFMMELDFSDILDDVFFLLYTR